MRGRPRDREIRKCDHIPRTGRGWPRAALSLGLVSSSWQRVPRHGLPCSKNKIELFSLCHNNKARRWAGVSSTEVQGERNVPPHLWSTLLMSFTVPTDRGAEEPAGFCHLLEVGGFLYYSSVSDDGDCEKEFQTEAGSSCLT